MLQWFKAWGVHVMAVFLTIKAIVVDGEEFIEKCYKILGIKTWIQRHIPERRHNNMKFLDSVFKWVESLFEQHAPEIVAAATPALQAAAQAATSAALQTASQDPKIQAGIAVYQAVKNYNAVANTPAPNPPQSA